LNDIDSGFGRYILSFIMSSKVCADVNISFEDIRKALPLIYGSFYEVTMIHPIQS